MQWVKFCFDTIFLRGLLVREVLNLRMEWSVFQIPSYHFSERGSWNNHNWSLQYEDAFIYSLSSDGLIHKRNKQTN